MTNAERIIKPKLGILVSPAGARCVWMRHDLETFKKRLKALEAKNNAVQLAAINQESYS